MIEKIRIIRTKTFDERARLLFMEIDQLGNYTHHQWFSDLDRRNHLRFYRILKDIWTYRAQIPSIVKSKICPLWDPFVMISSNSINMCELPFDQLQNVCISIIEDMIYTGIDNEYKTIGAFHVLSALTVVNQDARVSLPWLYESLVW
jgi:5-methylthioribose kinase